MVAFCIEDHKETNSLYATTTINKLIKILTDDEEVACLLRAQVPSYDIGFIDN